MIYFDTGIYKLTHKESGKIYIGQSKHLKRRLNEHNSNGKKYTTRKNGEWVLIYAEAYRAKEDALERETRLKDHGRAKQELLKRISNSKID